MCNMKIDTELIKSKEFHNAIRANLLNRSQEYRVLATLRYLYPNKFDTMILGESPDLQDHQNNIGIEVTIAANWKDMRASREFSKLCQGTFDEKKCKDAISKSGYSIIHIKENTFAISMFGTSDGEKSVFEESILRKVQKIPQYKKEFKKLGLAILLVEPITSDMEAHFVEWLKDTMKQNGDSYDYVYVISNRFCICYNTKENTFEKQFLKKHESVSLSKIARMTAEEQLTLSSIEWL